MAIFLLAVNEIIFRYPSNNRHDNYTSCVFHWHYKCYYEKLERVIEMITWSWNADTMRKIISGQNHIMQRQSQIMLLIRLFLICQCCLCHHGTHKHIWKKIYGSYLNKKFWNSLPLISVRNYTVVLCNDSMGNSFFFLWTLWCCLKRPYDKNLSTFQQPMMFGSRDIVLRMWLPRISLWCWCSSTFCGRCAYVGRNSCELSHTHTCKLFSTPHFLTSVFPRLWFNRAMC